MRREYARAPRGQRVTGTRPFRSWKTISLVGAIRLGEKPKLMTSRSTINGPAFLRFVKRRLAPWLSPGDVVIMDNLNIHKMLVVREAILDAGGIPVYLPTYSPELNPIEGLWADMKRQLERRFFLPLGHITVPPAARERAARVGLIGRRPRGRACARRLRHAIPPPRAALTDDEAVFKPLVADRH